MREKSSFRAARAVRGGFGLKSQGPKIITGAPRMRAESARSRLVNLLGVGLVRGAQLYCMYL